MDIENIRFEIYLRFIQIQTYTEFFIFISIILSPKSLSSDSSQNRKQQQKTSTKLNSRSGKLFKKILTLASSTFRLA